MCNSLPWWPTLPLDTRLLKNVSILCLVSRPEVLVRGAFHEPHPIYTSDLTTDIIELGIPFTDPIADGPTIQKANTVALKNGITVSHLLQFVTEARKKGLTIPVLFMGYYNPILQYGEERLLTDCQKAGVNGFIIVDLPPEEAVAFRNFCAKGGSVLNSPRSEAQHANYRIVSRTSRSLHHLPRPSA